MAQQIRFLVFTFFFVLVNNLSCMEQQNKEASIRPLFFYATFTFNNDSCLAIIGKQVPGDLAISLLSKKEPTEELLPKNLLAKSVTWKVRLVKPYLKLNEKNESVRNSKDSDLIITNFEQLIKTVEDFTKNKKDDFDLFIKCLPKEIPQKIKNFLQKEQGFSN